MIRKGDMVGVRYDIKDQSDDFEIYNVAKDPQQGKNLATQNIELQLEFKSKGLRSRIADLGAPRPYDTSLVPASKGVKVKNGLLATSYQVRSTYIPSDFGKAISEEEVGFPGIEEETGQGNLVEWTGYIKIPEDGKYTLYADRGQSHFFMRIHDISILDGNFKTENSLEGSVYLEAGYHPVKIYLLKTDPSTQLELSWKFQDESREIISSEFWFR